jgi:Zn-dependent protease with chaperone function
MTIAVTCGSCKAVFRVKDEYAGKRGKCPRCQSVVEVVACISEPRTQQNGVSANALPGQAKGQVSVESAPSPPVVPSANLVMQEILQAFHGDIEPIRRTTGYRIGILVLTLCMVALPAFYLALVAGIAYLVYSHATVNLARVGEIRSWWATVFLYAGPLIIGVVLLFFMIKPLFARRARTVKLRVLEFGEEPLLFALVTCVAQAVGAPEPKRIALDCQANASASFGSALGVLFGRNLTLTIGLPLVAGLGIQELAGVIAHELGHFTQGAAMRLSYVVRSINNWFARLVYERDDWDERLVYACQDEDNRLALFLYLALLCIALTRGVLWVFMSLGHALSCFMLRQMEYDADRYEARLAGVDNFAETERKLLSLGLVSGIAYQTADASWYRTGRLPDDVSALIVALSDGIPPKELRRLEKKLKKAKTGLFDTHPAHGERLASVRREKTAGIFELDGAATRLFKDFPAMSRAVTRHFYRQALGKRVKSDTLIPVPEFLSGAPEARARGIRRKP